MDTRQLADLMHTNEQIIRAWVRKGNSRLIVSQAAASSHLFGTRSLTGLCPTVANPAKQKNDSAR